ncbi:putative transcriptional regulator [Aurantimicrobium minutum]|uniref:helix-turn-helix transcriptional regulator n=1 Tax=Aurantimicrobium minutum TaxID=708131 RepID=UPI002404994A|nr:helix-turn-helix transcriptional regulator [Aurantimicrobium minutum]MDF9810609.1 putative transcriptional regulator [Aurantimicrobium minutum]
MKSSLRDLRARAELSQADLAELLGVSRQTINAIETEKYSPSLELAIRIARYFESNVEEVFHVD